LTGAIDIDPGWFVDRFPAAWDLWGRILKLEPAEIERLKQLARDLSRVQTGDGALWLGGDKERLRLLGVGVLKDVPRYRALQEEMVGVILPAVLRHLGATAPAATPAAPATGKLAVRLQALNPVLAKLGLAITARDDVVPGLELDALDLRVDTTVAQPSPLVARVLGLLGDRIGLALATRQDGRYLMALGPDAVGDLGRLARGEGADGGAGLDALLRRFAPGLAPALLYRADLGRILDLVAVLVPKVRLIPRLPQDLPPMVIAGGARGERTLDLVVALPTDLFKAFDRKPTGLPPPVPPPPKQPLVPLPPSAG
jgi:hypothetical protein